MIEAIKKPKFNEQQILHFVACGNVFLAYACILAHPTQLPPLNVVSMDDVFQQPVRAIFCMFYS